ALANNGLGQGSQVEVLALAIDPAAPMTLYAGLNNFAGTLFKTTDGGATWRASNTGLNFPGQTTLLTVQSLAIDPTATATLYAGTPFGGVYKTTNGGATWGVSNTGLPNPAVNNVVVDRSNPANVYVGVTAGSDAFAAKVNTSGSAFVWLTYLGGADNDDARGVTVDKDGAAYITGVTSSLNFPTAAPFQAASGGGSDAFVTKIDPAGSALVFSTYFGGLSADLGQGIAVNDARQVFITGSTLSLNLPVKNALQPSIGGSSDAFVAKFNAAGSALEYSTWLGGTGNDSGGAIAVDGAGNAYVTGNTASVNFPLADAPQTQLRGTDAFVAKLNPGGSALVYSTFLGGAGSEVGNAIAVDSAGNAYVVGNTGSQDFPLVNPLRPALSGGVDAFIAKLGIETDLAITKTASRNPVLVNNNFSFTLTVTNNGPSPATGVTVSDQLPAGMTFVSATSSPGSCANNAGTVTCAVGNLAAQGRATITLTVTPTIATAITNTASVAGNERDGNQSNNQASSQVTISNQPSIYGRVTLSNNNPLPGVTLNLTGAQTANRQTNNQGFYQFSDLQSGGDYTVTPSLNNYSFEPASRSFTTLSADQEANFVATQCSYALTPSNQTFDAAGGTGTITVMAPPRCPWTVTPNASWIKITSGASGAGNGSVAFSVDPATAPRSGHITIADQNFAIWQGVNVCNDLKFRRFSYYVFGSPGAPFTDDLDGDGLTDLIVPIGQAEFDPTQKRFAFPLTIYYGEAMGRLAPGPRIFATNVTAASSIAAGDINGDGRRDLVINPGNETDAQLLLNDGNRGFTYAGAVRLPPLNTFEYPDKLQVADLNKDGRPDLIGVSGSKLLISLNTSTVAKVSFAPPYVVSFEGQNFRGLADFNNDGIVDLLTVGGGFAGGPGVAVYLGDGLGSFKRPIGSPVTNFPVNADFADFNADGNLDIAMTAQTQTPQGNRLQVALLYGDGAGHFGRLTTFDPLLINPIGQEVKLIARDVNNDARPDVLVLGERKVRAVLTDPAGKPASMIEIGTTDDFDTSVLAVGNFDGGGGLDFVTIDGRRSSLVINWNRCGVGGLTIYGQTLDRNTPIGFGNVTVSLSGAKTVTTARKASSRWRGSTARSSFLFRSIWDRRPIRSSCSCSARASATTTD
ncbi:MAG TPA: SBBP repeat-containing protein, partial [Blastocatellia bacterium]|nr:SBBP repeat-containing protein [Blastocatellia bacterium]